MMAPSVICTSPPAFAVEPHQRLPEISGQSRRPARLPFRIRDLVVAHLEHGAGQAAAFAVAPDRMVDAVAGAVGLVDADAQLAGRPSVLAAALLEIVLALGIVGTAIKFGRAPEALVAQAVASMRRLNKQAAEALAGLAVHACTDITGFGLIGHSCEMATASGVTVELDAAAIPLFDGVVPLVAANRSGGLSSNRAYFGDRVHLASADAEALADLFFDPQTSGGLLVAVGPESADATAAALASAGVRAARIGRVAGPSSHALTIR